MSERLRVAHLITRLELGGAQLCTLRTVEQLDRAEFEPVLVYGEGGELEAEAQAAAPSERERWLVHALRPHADAVAVPALTARLRRLRPHVVHTHCSKAGILGRIAARAAGVPVVVHTFHGFGFTPAQRPAVRAAFVAAERLCARLTSHFIFVSDDNRRRAEALALLAGRPWSLIRSGVATRTSARAGSVRAELGIPRGAFVAVYVGNFKAQKNPLQLARVAAELVARDPSAHVMLVGDGELRPAVDAWLRERGVDRARVHLLGWRRDVPDVLAAADAFFMTSRWEGLPRTLVEAFVAGLPAVAYPVDGIRDLLRDGENGYAVREGDVAAAAERLLELCRQPALTQRMGRAARASVADEFDVERMVRDQERLYRALWNARGRRARAG